MGGFLGGTNTNFSKFSAKEFATFSDTLIAPTLPDGACFYKQLSIRESERVNNNNNNNNNNNTIPSNNNKQQQASEKYKHINDDDDDDDDGDDGDDGDGADSD